MKFKTPDKDYIKISLDRLTRFKPVIERYKRVFDDILNKFLIYDGNKLSDLDEKQKIKTAVEIFNSALPYKTNLNLNETIKKDEESVYYLTEEERYYLDSGIDFEAALSLFEIDELPLNLKRLKLQKDNNSETIRNDFSTLFPITKVVLVEGITEEILLIEFAKILNLDFKKEGIFVLGAGGKNQVAKKYYKLIEEIKIPIFILLDNDADETYEIITPKLRKSDEVYKIQNGEFEDILPKNLIRNALNLHFKENLITDEDNFIEGHNVQNISNCYKNNGWGDFKKADFAKIIREYLTTAKNPPVSDELILITDKIKLI